MGHLMNLMYVKRTIHLLLNKNIVGQVSTINDYSVYVLYLRARQKPADFLVFVFNSTFATMDVQCLRPFFGTSDYGRNRQVVLKSKLILKETAVLDKFWS